MVRGFTSASRATVSPRTVVGNTNAVPASRSPPPSGGSPPRPQPWRRKARIDSSGSATQLELLAGADLLRALARDRQRALDRGRVGVGAVDGEREPERHAARAAREVQPVVGRVVGLLVAVERVEVGGALAVRGARRAPARGTAARTSRTARTATCAGRRSASRRARSRRSARGRSARTGRPRRRRRRRAATRRARGRPRRRRRGRRAARGWWCRRWRRRRTRRRRPRAPPRSAVAVHAAVLVGRHRAARRRP